ncbi:hypothetical protein EJB05_18142, partial [Eragrostis curvula]
MPDNIKFILWSLLLYSFPSLCFGSDRDVQCLRTVQQSVVDPNGILKSTWTFLNSSSKGFICEFTGVECWHPDENRVLALRLSNLGRQGGFPQGLQNCTSMTAVDLSSNNFSGHIPSDIAGQMPFLTSLDLSYNSFSGEIPISIANLTLLNVVNLQHNQLSGQIPGQLSHLDRITEFNVADILLSGPIPWGSQRRFPASNFAGNQELCGAALGDCPSKRRWRLKPIKGCSLPKINDESSIGAAVGATGVEKLGLCFYSMPGMADNIKFTFWSLLLYSCSSLCFGSDEDVRCLKDVLQSVVDPNGYLKSTWTFHNVSHGFICQFTGVECWHPDENRVLALRLSNLGLRGGFPQGLENCSSMTALDLSNNNFSGPIPSDVSRLVPFITSLDLSYNSFSSEIPVTISNISSLSTLNLQHNQLSGPIPFDLGSKFPNSSFIGNLGLCGMPLESCKSMSNDESSAWKIGSAVGFIVGFVVAFYFPHWFVFSRRLQPYIVRIC